MVAPQDDDRIFRELQPVEFIDHDQRFAHLAEHMANIVGRYGFRQVVGERDGCRLGTGDAALAYHKFEFYHDWFALGNLMFFFHDWNAPLYAALDTASRLRFYETSTKWNKLESQPSSDDLQQLKVDLQYFEEHWTVCPTKIFAEELAFLMDQERMDTYGGATGSPKPMANG